MGDPHKHGFGKRTHESAVEFVRKREFDFAAVGRQLGHPPFALEAPERTLL